MTINESWEPYNPLETSDNSNKKSEISNITMIIDEPPMPKKGNVVMKIRYEEFFNTYFIKLKEVLHNNATKQITTVMEHDECFKRAKELAHELSQLHHSGAVSVTIIPPNAEESYLTEESKEKVAYIRDTYQKKCLKASDLKKCIIQQLYPLEGYESMQHELLQAYGILTKHGIMRSPKKSCKEHIGL